MTSLEEAEAMMRINNAENMIDSETTIFILNNIIITTLTIIIVDRWSWS